MRIKIRDLKSVAGAKLNGLDGTVEQVVRDRKIKQWDVTTIRSWYVDIDGNGRSLLKEINLDPIYAPPLQSWFIHCRDSFLQRLDNLSDDESRRKYVASQFIATLPDAKLDVITQKMK